MSTTYWTIEYSSNEHSFQDMGYAQPRLSKRPNGASELVVRVPTGTVNADYTIPFETEVVVRSGRSWDDEEGYSGGAIVFQGYRTREKRRFDTSPGYDVVFQDAWYALERLTFECEWKYMTTGGSTGSWGWYSRMFLFVDSGGTSITSGAQLEAVIDYAAACNVPIQAGTISLDTPLPSYAVRAVSCADAIRYCLRPSPDAVCWIDYTTDPPTFNAQKRSELTPVTYAYKDGVKHQSGDIEPRPDLQAKAVVIEYQKNYVHNDACWTQFSWDIYPAAFADEYGVPTSAARDIRVLHIPIDLRSAYRRDLKQTVDSAVADVDCDSSYEFWIANHPQFAPPDSPALNGCYNLKIHGSATVVDDNGDPVNLATYPNATLDTIRPWMKSGSTQIVGIPATVTAKFSYEMKDAAGLSLGMVQDDSEDALGHDVSVRVVLTNSAAGSVPYFTTQAADDGELPVTGMAQAIYDSLSELHWEGWHRIVEVSATTGLPQCAMGIGPQNTLRLSGGQAAWATMDAAVQNVVYDFTRGETTVQFGPPPALSPSEMIELAQMWRTRFTSDPPSIVGGGTALASMAGDVSGKVVNANTVPHLPTWAAKIDRYRFEDNL